MNKQDIGNISADQSYFIVCLEKRNTCKNTKFDRATLQSAPLDFRL